jgi:hypothetical protein
MAFLHLETSVQRIQQIRFLMRPAGRLIVLRAIRLHKTSLKRLRTNRFFESTEFKWVRMASRHYEKSLNRHHQSRILRYS